MPPRRYIKPPPKIPVEQVSSQSSQFLESIANAVDKVVGKPVCARLSNQIKAEIRQWYSTGNIVLDLTFGGGTGLGFPGGRIVEVFGPPSAGKSSLIYQVIGCCQADHGLGVLIDQENNFTVSWAERFGVKCEDLLVMRFDDAETFTIGVLDLIMRAYKQDPTVKMVVGWDSPSSTIPKAVLDRDPKKPPKPGSHALFMSTFLGKLTNALAGTNILFILANQMRSNINELVFGTDEAASGRALKFHTTVRVQLSKRPASQGENPYDPSMSVQSSTMPIKNKIGIPWMSGIMDVHHFHGFDEVRSMVYWLRSKGVLSAKGSWFEIGSHKYQGEEALLTAGRQNDDFRVVLRQMCIETFDEIISRGRNAGW